MGWGSGSSLMRKVIAAVKKHIAIPSARTDLYIELIKAFEYDDWDTQDECQALDPAFDEALFTLHPDWKDENQAR